MCLFSRLYGWFGWTDVWLHHHIASTQSSVQVETVWYQTKMPEKFGGYAGAYIDDGLHQRLLIALAFELHRALPEIMTGHDLQYLWAYKYDSDFTGINIHADQG